ncbi:hypothetical protein EQG63_05030 [Flavobacterium amnicola]|jgi:uncharacterized membrane protein|uniref:DUF3784 domain-containing protein n=1 Tax=Flavobacterium amnicola TaxID=2506422 RepID=A0A4Q1K5V1_9FLAO|nr:hypothetical protein [Flavobacterium amnicola]RXR21306.1 hypothetical protein EQG63_05030 [Flavobacterium amnicola]
MRKIDLFIGMFIGFISAIIGIYLFLEFKTEYGFAEGIQGIKQQGFLGKLIAMGAVLNLGVFFLLLKFNKDLMAKGVILATILLTFITLFV